MRGHGARGIAAALSLGLALALAAPPPRPATGAPATGAPAVVLAPDQCPALAGASGQRLPRPPSTGVAADVETVAGLVETERALSFTTRPVPRFVDPAELANQVRAATTGSTEQDRLDGLLLAALGAIPPGTDVAALLSGYLTQNVLGYYDDRSGRLVVGVADPRRPLDANGIVVLAHELEHALADQRFGLPDLDEVSLFDDAATAQRAHVEGDAVLTMLRVALRILTPAELATIGGGGGGSGASATSIPSFLRRAVELSYQEGFAFACARFDAGGGWGGVDSVYGALPTTTAQVLYPERYASHEDAQPTRTPASLPVPWVRARTVDLGAAALLALFEAPGDVAARALTEPDQRAAAWAGGAAVQWTDGSRHAVAVSLVQRARTRGLCQSVTQWYRRAFPDADRVRPRRAEHLVRRTSTQVAVIRCPAGRVDLAIAPDLATARELAP